MKPKNFKKNFQLSDFQRIIDMRKIKIPAEAVIDLCSHENPKPVEQKKGSLILFLDKIVYMRDTDLDYGLLRVDTGVDITVSKEWYKKLEWLLDNADMNHVPEYDPKTGRSVL